MATASHELRTPLTSLQLMLELLEDDVAATKRILAGQDGPTILVGHSYGGAVITEAGNDPKVAGLVYITAFAPEALVLHGAEPVGSACPS